ncbi:MAG: amidohydrolase family protein [Planctomycetes bacterium]|nr:amidohydrolase family protein [Planctomycetota bacterium]
MRRFPSLATLAAIAVNAAFGAALGAQDVLVSAAHITIAPDATLSPGRLLIRDGKVAFVGDEIPSEARQRARKLDYGEATIIPGFVMAQTTMGQDQDLAEAAFAFTPDLLAAEAFDPWHEDLAALAGLGITSFALSPSPRNVAGGIAALCKPGRDHARTADRELHLQLSLIGAARDQNRAPTSLLGAIDMLRTGFRDAKQGLQGGTDIAVLRQVLDGSRRAFIHASDYTELNAALDLAKEFAFEPVLVGAAEAEKVLGRLVQQKVAIVLGTLRPEMRLAELQLPATLARAGVPFCFAGDPGQLRLSAVLAIRHGLDRKLAQQALTRTPALFLGQQASIGSLRQGCAADFTVWSGDPLDLTSSLLATWVDGVRLEGDQPAGAR